MELYQSFTEEETELILKAMRFFLPQRGKPPFLRGFRLALRVVLVVLGALLVALCALLLVIGQFRPLYLVYVLIGILAIAVGILNWQPDTQQLGVKLGAWLMRRKLARQTPHTTLVRDGEIIGAKKRYPLASLGQIILCGDVAFCSIGKRVLVCKVPRSQQEEFLALVHAANPGCQVLYRAAEELTGEQ